MRGFIDTLQMPEIAADEVRRARYFDTLSRETRRLERLVADLLDVARFESGAIELDEQVFDTARLFEHVVRRHEQAARDLGVTLIVDVAPDADQVTGDPHRLEQAIENFVANASRHTPAGGAVTLSAHSDGTGLRLGVVDTGRGIPAEHLTHVFERFYKADPSHARADTGRGLGLSIVKAIAERHGGRVGVESRPGHTVFSLWLPGSPS
jgi:two-component system sensor histidine kinase BaeS